MLQKIKSFLFENKTDKQTIIKNTFWLMLAEGISKGGMFFITILIARKLGPEQFGILSFVMSFVAMFIVITDFGLTTLMVRELSRDHSKIKDYLVNLSFLKVVLGIITFILVWLVSHFIGKPDFYITLILIYVGYAILNNFGEFIRAFFRPSEKMQYEALLKIINGILMLVIVLLALSLYGDLESILWGYLIAGGMSVVISLVYVWKKFEVRRLGINKKLLKESIKSGSILLGSMIFGKIYVLSDQLILGYFGYIEKLGVYSSYFIITSVFGLLISIIYSTIIPKISKLYKKNNSELIAFLKKVDINIKIYTFILILFNILFGYIIIYYLLGEKYLLDNNIYVYYLLIIAQSLSILSKNKGIPLQLINEEKRFLKGVFISGTINIILNILLIPKFNIYGAVITTIISEIFIYFYFSKYLNKLLGK